jgi:Vitamin K-dependent gamma-carboxylase
VPNPDRRGASSGQEAGWFGEVPAYRLAAFRVSLAVTTVVFHIPKFNDLIGDYVASAFHVPPAIAWLPPLSPAAGMALPPLQYAAAVSLLFGFWSRTCAWFLAVAGAWVMLLDPEHYSHNAHFHLTLLALAGCANDRLSLRRLLREDDGAARCAAWPERLIRAQIAIVFFYAALDKVFSPFWGLSGTVLPGLRMAEHGFGLGLLQRANMRLLRAAPGVLSVVTMLTEFFLAAVALVPRLWPIGLAVGLSFVVSIEFLLQPGLFAWDLLVAGLVFLPAGDRGWKAFYSPACAACRRNRSLLSRLDWLRRLQWVADSRPVASPNKGFAGTKAMGFIQLVSPHDRAFCGLTGLRVLPIVMAPPFVIALAVARFGGGFLAKRGYGPWDDLPFLFLGAYLASWLPDVAQWWSGDRQIPAARGCAHRNNTEYS